MCKVSCSGSNTKYCNGRVGMRGEIGVQLFGLVSNNIVGIIFTTVGIWLINRMLPAVWGALLILRVRIFKNKE